MLKQQRLPIIALTDFRSKCKKWLKRRSKSNLILLELGKKLEQTPTTRAKLPPPLVWNNMYFVLMVFLNFDRELSSNIA